MKLISHLFGYLLHYANRDIPLGLKTEFYEIKKLLLKKYGEKVGQDIQHIKKDCYHCQNGIYYHSDWEEECIDCAGTGVYTEFWAVLDKYKLGKFDFHNPVEKMYSRPSDLKKEENLIEGYIKHSIPKYRLGTECALWLFLLFDIKTFWRRFGRFGYPRNKRTPLIVLSNFIFELSRFRWKNLLPKKKIKHSNEFYFADGIDDDLPF